MNEYTPDAWVLIEVKDPHTGLLLRKVLAGWVGGYLNDDSWRLSSGVTKIVHSDNGYTIHNESGSIYHVGIHNERFTNLTASIYEQLQEGQSVKQILIEDAKEYVDNGSS